MSSTTYQETTTTTYGGTDGVDQPKRQDGQGEKDNCCVTLAKCWITIIGLVVALFGLGVVALAIYVREFYGNYATFDSVMTSMGASGAVWFILAFGVVLFLCSVLLIVAGCCHDNASSGGLWKCILVVFAMILALLLILELVFGAVVFVVLNNLSLPPGEVGQTLDNAILTARTEAFNATYKSCCVTYSPPYTSVIDEACRWPTVFSHALTQVDAVCSTFGYNASAIEECLCSADAARYGYIAGVFLSSNLSFVGIVAIVFALLLLIAVIAAFVLICHHLKRRATYKPKLGQ